MKLIGLNVKYLIANQVPRYPKYYRLWSFLCKWIIRMDLYKFLYLCDVIYFSLLGEYSDASKSDGWVGRIQRIFINIICQYLSVKGKKENSMKKKGLPCQAAWKPEGRASSSQRAQDILRKHSHAFTSVANRRR